ncbi:GNAT family N-acetyltransferase [Naumannella sp. ID2617S]|nr:GNAT family N-acetyltransferase [Naumannella sp. ID2617S]
MELEHRTFRTTSDRIEDNPEFQGWWQAVHLGFHEGLAENQTIEWTLRQSVADNWQLRGAYDNDLPPEALSKVHPIGTFVSFEKTLNVGAGRLLPAHLVSQVTVRPTHRRQGILRRMMTDDLTAARDDGLAIAALTATEATIYGRFGFGPASFCQRISVTTDARFQLRHPTTGRVELTDQETMGRVAPQVYQRVHERIFGSIGREFLYAEERAGVFDLDAQKRNRKVRNALHFGADGRPDGFVCYSVSGFDTRPVTITVLDLCAVDGAAQLALWEFLGAIDLVERVDWKEAPTEDPLKWALADQRCYRVNAVDDRLWLRILDPVAALEGRAYACEDLDLVLEVSDRMGLAAGTFRIGVRDGQARVTPTTGPGEVRLDVEELGSLYLGGVDPGTLAVAGRLSGDEEALTRLRQLFTGFGRPWCNTMF